MKSELSKAFTAALLFIVVSGTNIAQPLRFDDPQKLPVAINSPSEESYPILSPDGKSLYFTRVFYNRNVGGRLAGSDIWVSELDDQGVWTEAYSLPQPINNKDNNLVIGLSASGERLYLLNAYKKTSKSDVAMINRLFEDQKPRIADIPKINEKDGFLGLYMHPSEKILLVSMAGEDTHGQEDLYVMLKDSAGNWSEPTNLGSNINSEGFEISPYLSEDGAKLYFASNGHGGLGNADIFVAERLYNTWNVWTRPRNLGDKINSPAFDAYFYLAGDKAFFTSNRDGEYSDIFVAPLKLNEVDSTHLQIQRLIEDAKKLIGEEEEDNNNSN